MKIMIHACPQRMWYVDGFLVPLLVEQGIPEGDILVRCDTERLGNLRACLKRLREAGTLPGGTWHIQDDVLPCRDFAQRAEAEDYGIAWGFACENFGDSPAKIGEVPVAMAWHSFQCIRLPNDLAGEAAAWIENEAGRYQQYLKKIRTGKCDDELLRAFLIEVHGDLKARDLFPCMVEHIDTLIGGTVLNHLRRIKENRAIWFDRSWTEEFAKRLKQSE